jgi:hypothetical protein
VVTPYWLGVQEPTRIRAWGGTLYLDVELRKAAYQAEVYTRALGPDLPAGLVWRGWGWLSLWPLLWLVRELWDAAATRRAKRR